MYPYIHQVGGPIVLHVRQGREIIDDRFEVVEVVLQRGGTLALLPGIGAVIVLGLHLVTCRLQRALGLCEECVPAGATGHGGQRCCRGQPLRLLFIAAGLRLACAVGRLFGGGIGVLTRRWHGDLLMRHVTVGDGVRAGGALRQG